MTDNALVFAECIINKLNKVKQLSRLVCLFHILYYEYFN